MSSDSKKSVTIIGSGLAGSYLAILLARRGYKVDIYERFTEKEILDTYASARSYNLTFYDYGVNALKEAEVWETLEPLLVTLNGCIAQIAQNPAVTFKRESLFFTVQRNILLKTLIQKARTYSNVRFHFGESLIAVHRSEKEIVLENVTKKKHTQVPYSVLIGADGVHSLVRPALQQGHSTNHKQEYADWEYKQIHIDKNHAKKMQLDKNYMYAWTRKDTFMLAHPNSDSSFSALLVMPKDTNIGFNSLHSADSIKKFIQNNYVDFIPATEIAIKEILHNPISNFITIYTEPWYHQGTMAIIGDAAHGFNPFYGQGVSAGFADCLTLAELIDAHGLDWETIFVAYQKARKQHTDALATLSKESIAQHLREKRADYDSVYNKIDTMLYRVFPTFFYPPPYIHIPTNPLLAGEYLKNHQAQRRRNMLLGFPIIVALATGIIALHEALNKKKRK